MIAARNVTAGRQSRLEQVNFHDLRHSCASIMLALAIDLYNQQDSWSQQRADDSALRASPGRCAACCFG